MKKEEYDELERKRMGKRKRERKRMGRRKEENGTEKEKGSECERERK